MASGKRTVVLTIAGFDPSSGAGIIADLKTVAAHGCFGVACITALTVQNTQGVLRVEPVRAGLVRETLANLAADLEIDAIKVGMLAEGEIATVVADFFEERRAIPVVLDPVIRSSSGAWLLKDDGVAILRKRLMPLATVVTPNLAEAEELSGSPVRDLEGMKSAAQVLQTMGARGVVITGGHLPENTDLLLTDSGEEFEITGEKIASTSTHGTGCAFSTAIACRLAQGEGLREAVSAAKDYVRQAIARAYPLGKGKGPLNHLFSREG